MEFKAWPPRNCLLSLLFHLVRPADCTSAILKSASSLCLHTLRLTTTTAPKPISPIFAFQILLWTALNCLADSMSGQQIVRKSILLPCTALTHV